LNPDFTPGVYGHVVFVVHETELNGTPASPDERVEDDRVHDKFNRLQLVRIGTGHFRERRNDCIAPRFGVRIEHDVITIR
jgi:hypothetical protein